MARCDLHSKLLYRISCTLHKLFIFLNLAFHSCNFSCVLRFRGNVKCKVWWVPNIPVLISSWTPQTLETWPSLTSSQISLSSPPRSPSTFSLLACLCFLFMLACCLAWRFCADLILLQHVRYVPAFSWHMPRSCQKKMSWWDNCFLFVHSALCLTVIYCSVVLKAYMLLIAFDI